MSAGKPSAAKAFFDTNVLLYIRSRADPAKRARSKALFEEYSNSSRIVLSTQVVQEFYVAGLRKLNIPRSELHTAVITLLELPLVRIGPDHILRAIHNEERFQISFWDALIVAAAESAQAGILFTEDLNHGQFYGTVRVENPFLTEA